MSGVRRDLPEAGVLDDAGPKRRTVVALVVVGLVTSFLVYRPDRHLPFDFIDFSEFLPLLRHETFVERLRALLAYYMDEQGRANVVGYVLLSAKWGLLGENTPAWQWLRFAAMWSAVTLTYLLLRRLGLARLACLAGASLLLFSPPAVDGWTRLTMAEPSGTLLLFAACFVALRESGGTREWRIGLAFAAICGTLVLLKEMLAATLVLPFLLVVAVSPRRGLNTGRRLRTLGAAALSVGVLAAVPVMMVAQAAPADAYTSAFGSRIRPLPDALAQWTLAIAPFDLGTSFPPRLAGLALVTLLALLGAGWMLRLRRPDTSRRQSLILLAIGLLFPLVGTVSYLPWPSYNRFYAIPFLFGGAVLAAVAFSAIEARSLRAASLAVAAWGVFLLFAAADAAGQASRMAARQTVNLAVVKRVAALHAGLDSILVATDQRPPEAWQGVGPTLQRYGEALGYSMPSMVNTPCDESRRHARSGDVAILAFSSQCGGLTGQDAIVYRYRRVRLPDPRPRPDSFRVDFLLPSGQRKSDGGQ